MSISSSTAEITWNWPSNTEARQSFPIQSWLSRRAVVGWEPVQICKQSEWCAVLDAAGMLNESPISSFLSIWTFPLSTHLCVRLSESLALAAETFMEVPCLVVCNHWLAQPCVERNHAHQGLDLSRLSWKPKPAPDSNSDGNELAWPHLIEKSPELFSSVKIINYYSEEFLECNGLSKGFIDFIVLSWGTVLEW